MSLARPYTKSSIEADIRRLIRLHSREQLAEPVCDYIMEYFIPRLLPKGTGQKTKNPDLIIGAVCKHFAIPLEFILIKTRDREIVYPRKILSYFLAIYSTMTLVAISKMLGQNHSNIVHSRSKTVEEYSKKKSVRDDVDAINNLIKIKRYVYDKVSAEVIDHAPRPKTEANLSSETTSAETGQGGRVAETESGSNSRGLLQAI